MIWLLCTARSSATTSCRPWTRLTTINADDSAALRGHIIRSNAGLGSSSGSLATLSRTQSGRPQPTPRRATATATATALTSAV